MPLLLPLPLSGVSGVIVGVLIALGTHAPTRAQPRAASYPDIIDRYRAGAFEDAVYQLLPDPKGHDAGRVERELKAIARRIADPEALSAVLSAAAVMHFDAANRAQHADPMLGVGHAAIARFIVDWKPWARALRDRPDALRQLDALRRDIELGIVWMPGIYRSHVELFTELQRLHERYPKDAEVLVTLGTYEELRSTPQVRTGSLPEMGTDVESRQQPMIGELRSAAVKHFRMALTLDPAYAEARVRLGRVLYLQGELKEARAALEDPIEPEPPMVLFYLGSLFLAEVIEKQGDAAGALVRYQAIAARWPECQSAQIALSRAHAARGEREEASRALAPLWLEPKERACRDPWQVYRLGPRRNFGVFMEALRARVRAK